MAPNTRSHGATMQSNPGERMLQEIKAKLDEGPVRLPDFFKQEDEDGEWRLSPAQLWSMLLSLGIRAQEKDRDAFLVHLGKSPDQDVSLNELKSALRELGRPRIVEDVNDVDQLLLQLKAVLDSSHLYLKDLFYTKDGDLVGSDPSASVADLQARFEALGLPTTEEECVELATQVTSRRLGGHVASRTSEVAHEDLRQAIGDAEGRARTARIKARLQEEKELQISRPSISSLRARRFKTDLAVGPEPPDGIQGLMGLTTPGDLETVFNMLDVGKHGSLDRERSRIWFRCLGWCLSDKELDVLLGSRYVHRRKDDPSQRELDSTFFQVVRHHQRAAERWTLADLKSANNSGRACAPSLQEIGAALKRLNHGRSKITRARLREICQSRGITDDELDELLQEIGHGAFNHGVAMGSDCDALTHSLMDRICHPLSVRDNYDGGRLVRLRTASRWEDDYA